MDQKLWQQVTVSPCATFHLLKGEPLYRQRFSQVMKYHEPGLAPVKTDHDAFHIDLQGNPVYSTRFIETFGFYQNLAAVKDQQGWFHINCTGAPAYPERYAWCGNFQEGFCPVKDQNGGYFHIDRQGQKAYPDQYAYAGDFKEGVAVVCNQSGLHTHIDHYGRLLHKQWFIDLDIFHKGFARAKDAKGWFHINKQGKPLYSQRYAAIEPFYNGIARVETFNGALLTIDTTSAETAQLRPASQTPWQSLSADMVGFWRTETIATAVQLNVFDCLPNTSTKIAAQSNLPTAHLERLLRALWELDLVDFRDHHWHLTAKGQLLAAQQQNFLPAAATLWSDVNTQVWKRLPTLLRSNHNVPHPLFKAHASDKKLQLYHQALDGYATQDFSTWQIPPDWSSHQKLIGVGRTAKVWLEKLLQKYPHQQACLLGEEYVLKYPAISPEIMSRYSLQAHHILELWPQTADAVLFPRLLHYWPDQQVITILSNARRALSPTGKIYIFEMLLTHEDPNGSLLDLNMLAESGGKLRFLSEWRNLLAHAQLQLIQNTTMTPWLNVLVAQHLSRHD